MVGLTIASICIALAGNAQHDQKPQEAMKKVGFLVGSWKGTQTFITPGSNMVGKAVDRAEWAVGGRFIEERLSTTLPKRKPTDTRHLLAFDPHAGVYHAYWFNDTSPLPMELTGTVHGKTLTLMTGGDHGPKLRFVYAATGSRKLTITFEMQQGSHWTLLFRSSYSK